MSTIADLPVGAKLKFGAYRVGDETPHKISWIKVHNDGTLLSEYIEDQCAFDAKEPDSFDEYRRMYGNNRYSLSNIHQFLNATSYGWYEKAHECDEEPNDDGMTGNKFGYVHKPGFLHYFDSWELEAIDCYEIEARVPRDDVEYDTIERFPARVFLPSKTNLFGSTEGGVYEGVQWDMFRWDDPPIASRFTHELYQDREWEDRPDNETDNFWYWLRTPQQERGYGVRCVNDEGGVSYDYANEFYVGIRPALKLNPETPVSDDPDEYGYYEVLEREIEIIEITEEDFLAILKNE